MEFQVDWTSGDQTWIPYLDLVGSTALGEYFNFLGIEKVSDLQMPCEGTPRHLLDKDTMERQRTRVTSDGVYLQRPSSSRRFLFSHRPSTRRKNSRKTALHTTSIPSFAMNLHPDAPTTPNIRRAGPLWFIVRVYQSTRPTDLGFHWDQVRSFYEYDDSLRRHLHMLEPMGYREFRSAYVRDHPNSVMRFLDPTATVLDEASAAPDAQEYLGVRRPVTQDGAEDPLGLVGGNSLTSQQQTIMRDMLWQSGARVAHQGMMASRSFEARQSRRTGRNFTRGPVVDQTHRLPTLFEVQHPTRGTLAGASTTIRPTSTLPVAPAPPTPVAGPSTAGPSRPNPTTLLPEVPVNSHLDEPVLMDEDLLLLYNEEPVTTGTAETDETMEEDPAEEGPQDKGKEKEHNE